MQTVDEVWEARLQSLRVDDDIAHEILHVVVQWRKVEPLGERAELSKRVVHVDLLPDQVEVPLDHLLELFATTVFVCVEVLHGNVIETLATRVLRVLVNGIFEKVACKQKLDGAQVRLLVERACRPVVRNDHGPLFRFAVEVAHKVLERFANFVESLHKLVPLFSRKVDVNVAKLSVIHLPVLLNKRYHHELVKGRHFDFLFLIQFKLTKFVSN